MVVIGATRQNQQKNTMTHGPLWMNRLFTLGSSLAA
ncbi:hypothetical protein C8J32_11416 [Rhizobium sp. PP-CC-3A-592]|nr:hypothetical protein C8J32_11416 [Rhizobium sp. PP-CC-3A-592]